MIWAILIGWVRNNTLRALEIVAVIAFIIASIFLVRESGKQAERYNQAKINLEVKNAQIHAAMSGPRNRDDLIKRLLDGKF